MRCRLTQSGGPAQLHGGGVADRPQVVIRTYGPARAWVVGAVLAIVAALSGYLLFEYGRASAGYDRLAAMGDEGRLKKQIRERDDSIRTLRREAASLEAYRAGQTEERAEVARTIGELQAEVARQAQELAFYKGIVVADANEAEIKIQQLRVSAGSAERRFVVRLTLVQADRPDNVVSGNVVMSLDGLRGTAPVTLKLAALTGGADAELPFSFRYFENLNPEIVIPNDFQPERLNVEIRSSRRGVSPVTQTLLWTVETG